VPARRGLADGPGQAEVDQHRPAVAQHHVARLDVQVGQAAVVQVAEGGGQLHADQEHVDRMERPVGGQGVVEGPPLDVLEHQEGQELVEAGLEQPPDPWVGDRPRDLRLLRQGGHRPLLLATGPGAASPPPGTSGPGPRPARSRSAGRRRAAPRPAARGPARGRAASSRTARGPQVVLSCRVRGRRIVRAPPHRRGVSRGCGCGSACGSATWTSTRRCGHLGARTPCGRLGRDDHVHVLCS
jgi:hypothetical protein